MGSIILVGIIHFYLQEALEESAEGVVRFMLFTERENELKMKYVCLSFDTLSRR